MFQPCAVRNKSAEAARAMPRLARQLRGIRAEGLLSRCKQKWHTQGTRNRLTCKSHSSTRIIFDSLRILVRILLVAYDLFIFVSVGIRRGGAATH